MQAQILKPAVYLLLIFCLLSGGISPLKAASKYPFISENFDVPEKLETNNYRLRMLTINDVIKDYEAVMSSVDHLSRVWPDSGWPKGLTLERNLIDLGWHQREFLRRSSFAYTMVTLDESKVIGCVYIYPTRKTNYDAEVYLWVRESEIKSGLDTRLFNVIKTWLDDDWPFNNPAFPGRDINWDEWELLSESP